MAETRDLWKELINEMESRRQKGLLEYQKPVDGSDCEDWLQHATYEFLDGAIYCMAAKVVFERMAREIQELRDKLNDALDTINRINSDTWENSTYD